MARYLSFRDGGKTDEKGISRYISKFLGGSVLTGLNVTQQGPLALGVTVAIGDIMIDSGNSYPYIGWNDAAYNITLATADGTNPRYDLIVAYVDLAVVQSTTSNNVDALKIIRVTGTPAGSPSEPNAGAIQTAVGGSNPYSILARVTVAAGATTIANSAIVDRRTMAYVSAQSAETAAGNWNLLNSAPSAVSYLGNRSYQLTFTNSNLTTLINPGTKLRTTRTANAPTQSTSLNGSTQYFSRASGSLTGVTFTDDFVASAWIKLTSFPAAAAEIITRYNGTSGWQFEILSNGTVQILGRNAAAGNYSLINSYQSLDLNKWYHVAAQLDMSAFTATTTTSYIMIDGENIASFVARGGTNPTALVQAGNLEIGATNGGATPFTGKLAQVALYNAKVTQANVIATISQGLTGSETSLISAWSFNNSINDLNANANNLTAQGSAVATNADSPFGGQDDGTISATLDYMIVQKTVYSTDSTITVQVAEGCTIPTTGGVSAVSYSAARTPYGFPSDSNKFVIITTVKQTVSTSGNTTNTVYNPGGINISLPIGAWRLGYAGIARITAANQAYLTPQVALSTSQSAVTDTELHAYGTIHNVAATDTFCFVSRNKFLAVSAKTPYYMVMYSSSATISLMTIDGGQSPMIIRAENAYV